MNDISRRMEDSYRSRLLNSDLWSFIVTGILGNLELLCGANHKFAINVHCPEPSLIHRLIPDARGTETGFLNSSVLFTLLCIQMRYVSCSVHVVAIMTTKDKSSVFRHVAIHEKAEGNFKAKCNYCPSKLSHSEKAISNPLLHMKVRTTSTSNIFEN